MNASRWLFLTAPTHARRSSYGAGDRRSPTMASGTRGSKRKLGAAQTAQAMTAAAGPIYQDLEYIYYSP
eukprot:6178877-Pleurochrysis_carterae.AAC.9